jgi:hypothetical protein
MFEKKAPYRLARIRSPLLRGVVGEGARGVG